MENAHVTQNLAGMAGAGVDEAAEEDPHDHPTASGGEAMWISRSALEAYVQDFTLGGELVDVQPLDIDLSAAGDTTLKGIGYGHPFRLSVKLPAGAVKQYVFHSAVSDQYGHDRRSDRASSMVLAYDTAREVPHHAAALDVGAVDASGQLISLKSAGEFFLLTEWVPGSPYAKDLRAIGAARPRCRRDFARAHALANYLAALHQHRPAQSTRECYRRSVRDLIGSGEGIYGIVDGYPADTPGAPPARLQRLERLASDWRWRLRNRDERLRTIHGDFHPFNIVFDESDEPALLDASRGCVGDPADDVTALAVNFVFFALPDRARWRGGLRDLWFQFWERYLEKSGDRELLAVSPPYLTWRLLVLANPVWYPAVTGEMRDTLLQFADRALTSGRLDPAWADDLF